jgi:L-cysteine:1D-myo-inositol 2-amino-2-deoxy-alpha-D-glucopyranoside ligase
VHDSASGELHTLPTGSAVSLYVCGITPYDATHMGHAATYVAFDTLVRAWTASGATVRYTQNVTDIDDPLLERANATGKDWRDIAKDQTDLFRSDMVALRVVPPNWYVGAVESIPQVVERILDLQSVDAVYNLEGDLYYDISHAHTIGKVAHLTQIEMQDTFAARGGDPARPGKRNPLDALVWRNERPGEPSWATEIGTGRPGWHIECAAIALDTLGNTIDVQGGGSDLKFPHHEMSAAHAETATGIAPFARTFMHTGMVALDGQKMSKSLGNLVFVSKLREQGVDPMAVRLAILSHHYRDDWEWFDSGLRQAVARLDRWRTAFASSAGAPDISNEIASAVADDLNTPAAIDLIDRWISAGDRSAPGSPQLVARTVDALLGIV